MGHYCRICERVRPNERFTGRGHKKAICKECSRLPKAEIESVLHLQEVWGFLEQSNISPKNLARLQEIVESPNEAVRQHAELVLEVARIAPRKRRRVQVLARQRPDLVVALEETGLIEAMYHD